MATAFLPAAVAAADGAFFAVVVVVLLIVALTFPPFFTTVVLVLDTLAFELLLWALAALTVLSCRLGRGGGAMVVLLFVFAPRVVVAVDDFSIFSFEAVRARRAVAAPVPRFACSTMPCREAEIAEVAAEAADLSGEAGFRGEVGRAM